MFKFFFPKFFSGLLNLHWAQNPRSVEEPLNRAMAAVIVAIAWTSSFYSLRRRLKDKGIVIAAAGIVQAWAALH